eukprot:jgi/Hompol1/6632/HPOL_001978-RA
MASPVTALEFQDDESGILVCGAEDGQVCVLQAGAANGKQQIRILGNARAHTKLGSHLDGCTAIALSRSANASVVASDSRIISKIADADQLGLTSIKWIAPSQVLVRKNLRVRCKGRQSDAGICR